MSERPILFSAPMVRAILEDRKTQTRRAMKPQPHFYDASEGFPLVHGETTTVEWKGLHTTPQLLSVQGPYGRPGDRLWVRETSMPAIDAGGADYRYAADYDDDGRRGMAQLQRWTPSIHMPRKASRITLEITGVRVERLNDISEADAIAEGIERDTTGNAACRVDPVTCYYHLWNAINGPGAWEADPWVWVVEFKRVEV